MPPLYGEGHKALVAWLFDEWRRTGPTVCCLEGFPGVGKTEIGRQLVDQLREKQIKKVWVAVPEPREGQFDDLLFDLSQEFAAAGDSGLARLIDEGAEQRLLMRAVARAAPARVVGARRVSACT